MPFAELPTGAGLQYEDAGEGPPLILIHGMLDTPATHLSQLIDWLSADYRVIAPTLRGYGESTPKPRDFPLDFYRRDALDVLALIAHLDLSPAYLLGYSDGGEVALIMAGTEPARFRALLTWGAVGYFGPEMRSGIQRFYPPTWITDAQRELHHTPELEKSVMQWIRSMKMLIDLGGDVSLSLAPQITMPALLLLGRQDHLNPVSCLEVMVAKLPQGRYELFDCGHPIHHEQWEAFRATVGRFLDSVL